jgi:hypothetical protein
MDPRMAPNVQDGRRRRGSALAGHMDLPSPVSRTVGEATGVAARVEHERPAGRQALAEVGFEEGEILRATPQPVLQQGA